MMLYGFRKDKVRVAMGMAGVGRCARADQWQDQGQERTVATQQEPLPSWQRASEGAARPLLLYAAVGRHHGR